MSKTEAFRIAIVEINKAFTGSSSNIRDYEISFDKGSWLVTPSLDKGQLGGGASAMVNDNTQKVSTFFAE